jgi:hypothetical protein
MTRGWANDPTGSKLISKNVTNDTFFIDIMFVIADFGFVISDLIV